MGVDGDAGELELDGRAALEGEETLAYHRLLLAQFFLCISPGVLTFFQGAEFFEPAAFAENPAALNPPQKVGSFEGGQWSEEGPYAGLFNATRRLVALRQQYKVAVVVRCDA